MIAPIENVVTEAQPSETTPASKRTALIVVISSIACLAVLGVVLASAMEQRKEAEAFIAGGANEPPPFPGDGIRRGNDPSGGCGRVDPEQPPAMTIELPPEGIDFGDLRQGEVVEKRVAFKSTGKGLLCVMRADTTCGCLKVTLDETDHKYEPGDRGYVTLRIDTTGQAEPVNKNVAIVTNDLDKPRHVFPVRARISRGLVIAPKQLSFGQTAVLTESEGTLFLRTPKDMPVLEIAEVRGTRPIEGEQPLPYAWELERTLPGDPDFNRYKLHVTAPPISKVGAFVDRLVMRTNLEGYEEVSVAAKHLVSPRIRPVPLRFAMGTLRPGVRTTRPVRIRLVAPAKAVEFKITGVRVEARGGGEGPSGYHATFGQTEGGGPWWVDLVYDGSVTREGRLNAVVIAETDDERQPEVRIDVRGVIRAPR